MEQKLLLPNRYKKWGLVLLLPSLLLGILVRFKDFQFSFLTLPIGKAFVKEPHLHLDEAVNLTDELALTGIIVSLLFIAFAREKSEDEFIAHTRLSSLQWAVLLNYVLLLLATWLVHGLGYIDVMMYNMLTVLILFIIRFNYVLNSNKKSVE
ncbi:MAG TPA: hypothetical protein VL307_15180 [Chitinophagaceae bacterium]|nr:hypothetical protein [Chitinophagaceae bacterium]